MLFNTIQFAIFFSAGLLAYRASPRQSRNSLLLVSSLVFYFMWIPPYLILLLADAAVNYALLRWMVRSAHPRLFLGAAVAFSLGVLAYFKYAAFLIEAVLPVSLSLFELELPIPEILLPLGISFFTFQIMGLSIDTYRGQIEAVKSFREYFLFISFFPQLIAGPILRGHQFLPQLRRGGQMNPERTRRGIWLLASGVSKKVILADFLLSGFVDSVFASPGDRSAPFHLVATYSFAFQIYFDFSGYTDIARGLALLLGFEIPLNFREPYLSRNPAEFWTRWHITLSRWLRDYLYIPLGGNRRGPVLTYRNLMITMLLGGLWHGAAWNFLIWGGLHGLLLVVHRKFGKARADAERPLSLRDLPKIVCLFHVVCLLWIFFRAESFAAAIDFTGRLLTGSFLGDWPVVQTGIVVLCAALHVLERSIRLHLPRLRESLLRPWGALVEGAALGAIAALSFALGGAGGEFIYFQF